VKQRGPAPGSPRGAYLIALSPEIKAKLHRRRFMMDQGPARPATGTFPFINHRTLAEIFAAEQAIDDLADRPPPAVGPLVRQDPGPIAIERAAHVQRPCDCEEGHTGDEGCAGALSYPRPTEPA
jgi:hypothetical protein